ncbi:MAG: UDP-N-acetylglucosamine 2-epimerase (non-hydrolyzing) [Pirellulaceae bacterium]|jgi:UDP-N-acetylglucosamine 2-epimerase (non-hydrolysing)|nr:UDP-N-acetylglucosamine 2-epimerase (non-hydrolyzing) [Pirellulaceae bacterium]
MARRVLLTFGTRPEAIKMAPVYEALRETRGLQPVVCVTAQHRELLDQVLLLFGTTPEYDLNIMTPGQDLFDVTEKCLCGLRDVYREAEPDLVLVHGDTTTTLAAALAAYYSRVPVGHVEAGLRTGDKHAPFPEEMNRRMVGSLADLHFAPTRLARRNLRRENIPAADIFFTGNTVVDAPPRISAELPAQPHLEQLYRGKRLILMTAHRRENFGEPLETIFRTVAAFVAHHPEFQVVFPVHPNPNVRKLAHRLLGHVGNISLIEPVDYAELIFLLRECQFVLTDSGGLQEEAPSLGKPVLVLRETTERPEAIEAGGAIIVGHDERKITSHMEALADPRSDLYRSMQAAENPFGDGQAGLRIARIIRRRLCEPPVAGQQTGDENVEPHAIKRG